jgi:outer membrane protein assembly factor BamB
MGTSRTPCARPVRVSLSCLPVAALLLVAAPTVHAQPPTAAIERSSDDPLPSVPAISLSRRVGPPTTALLVNGTGFSGSELVDLFFDGGDLPIVTATASGGTFSAAFTVPAAALPGRHPIIAVGRQSRAPARAPFMVRTDWRQFRFDNAHSGVNPFENVLSPANVANLEVIWSVTTGGLVTSTPAVVADVVYVASGDGRVYALDAHTGVEIWRSAQIDAGVSSPAVIDGVVYIGTGVDEGAAYALDARTGAVLWSTETGGISSSPCVGNGLVYFGTNNDSVIALRAVNGEVVWETPTNNSVQSSPALAGGRVYAASGFGTTYAFDASTGAIVWQRSTGFPAPVFCSPAVAEGRVFIGSGDSFTYALSAETGNVAWRTFTPFAVVFSSPAVSGGVVYIGVNDATLWALQASNGARVWGAATNGIVNSSPAVANGVIYVGCDDRRLYVIEQKTGAVLTTFDTGGPVFGSPVVANGKVYFGSFDRKVYALGLN